MTPVSIHGEDTGPPRRRKPPARPHKGDGRKRGSTMCGLRPLRDKCKTFALTGSRNISLALAALSAEELVEWLEANTQGGEL
jgi:hypothetical protein